MNIRTIPARHVASLALSVLLLLIARPLASAAEPMLRPTDEPPSFLESIQCAVCHANASRAVAMRDAQERGIAPFDLWRSSAMANSSRDPFWRAVLSAEVAATPTRKALIEEKCTRCHAPMAAPAPESPPAEILAHLAGDNSRALLGMDGVSCTLCHQIREQGLGTEATFTGHFIILPKGPLFGPHADPFAMPMQHHTGYTPTLGRHVLRSGLCAACHTLDTDAVGPDGMLAGHTLHEQSPYREWRNSVYNDEREPPTQDARSCQACHMPTRDDDGQTIATRIAHNPGGRDFPFLQARSPFGRHTFYGGNVLLTRLLIDNHEDWNVPAPRPALESRLAAATNFLQHQAARLTIGSVQRVDRRWEIPVTVTNLAGHKLPTAYPSRRVWVRIEVRDATGTTQFCSGGFDAQGRLLQSQGQRLPEEQAGGPLLPHFVRIRSSGEVQVYESVMGDAGGQPTFTLLRGARYVKDNRLLPRGWQPAHPDANATSPVGTASDVDFGNGGDTVLYEVPVKGPAPHSVQVWLHYQVVSPRYAAELFTFDTPQVQSFHQWYEQLSPQPETLATAGQSLP